MNLKKVAIYPYHAECISMVRHLEQLNPMFQIESLVIARGFQCDGEDAGLIYHKPAMGITVTENIEEALDACDCVIITNGFNFGKSRKAIMHNMELAMQKKK